MTFQGRRCFALLERAMYVLPTLIYKLGMGLRFGRGDFYWKIFQCLQAYQLRRKAWCIMLSYKTCWTKIFTLLSAAYAFFH